MPIILANMPTFSTFLGAGVVLVGLAFPASSFGFADTAANTAARHAMTLRRQRSRRKPMVAVAERRSRT